MEVYQWMFEMTGKVILPWIYAVHDHYETDYHGLLLSKGT